LPDFSWYNIPKREKIYQMTAKHPKRLQNIPNGLKNIPKHYKTYQMDQKINKWSHNLPISPVARLSKNYPNWEFWFENKPSGNPARQQCCVFSTH
jgi:hypothetical protein